MPPQRDDRARLRRLAPWVLFLGFMAAAMATVHCIFVHTSGQHVVDGATTNKFADHYRNGDLGTPREIALTRTAAVAAEELTAGSSVNLPWLSSSATIEEAAVNALANLRTTKLIETLYQKVAEDRKAGGKRRLSTTARFLALMVSNDRSSCPRETPLITRDENSCAGVYGTCHSSCNGGLFNRPVPGACHLVCAVLEDKCKICAAGRKRTTLWKVRREVRSWVSASEVDALENVQEDTVGEMGNADTREPSFAMSRAFWILLLALWFVQTVGCIHVISRLTVSLSNSERRLRDLTRVQEEQAASIAASNENDDEMVREEIDDNVDRPAAEETPANGGLLAAGYNFATGWTTDRARELGIVV